MSQYIYTGLTREKKNIKGKITASSHREAVLALKESGVIAIYSLRKKYEIPWLEKPTLFFRRIAQKTGRTFATQSKESEIVSFLQKLATEKKELPDINIFIDRSMGEEEIPEQIRPKIKKKNISKIQKEYSIPWDRIARPSRDIKKIKVSRREIAAFARQFSVLLDSGVTLPRGLYLMAQERSHSAGFKKIINTIYSEIRDGNPLSYVMSRFPYQFDSLCLGLISVGEATGTLNKSFGDMANYLETQDKIKKQVKGAMSYPVIILIAVVVVVLFGGNYLMPMFEDMFLGFDMELPLLTRVVFFIAEAAQYVVAFLIVLLLLVKLLFRASPPARARYAINKDLLLLRLPFIKNLVTSMAMYYFTYTLALMLKNGIKVTDSLSVAAKTVSNRIISFEINECAELIVEGVSLSEAMSAQSYFSPLVCNMTNTGEEAGRLDNIMQHLAGYYSEDFKSKVETAMQFAQPASILLVAAIAVPVILAIFIPVLDISSGAFMR